MAWVSQCNLFSLIRKECLKRITHPPSTTSATGTKDCKIGQKYQTLPMYDNHQTSAHKFNVIYTMSFAYVYLLLFLNFLFLFVVSFLLFAVFCWLIVVCKLILVFLSVWVFVCWFADFTVFFIFWTSQFNIGVWEWGNIHPHILPTMQYMCLNILENIIFSHSVRHFEWFISKERHTPLFWRSCINMLLSLIEWHKSRLHVLQ